MTSGLWGYADTSGPVAVAARFDRARPFNAAGTAPVLLGEEWGPIAATGARVVEPCFRRLDASTPSTPSTRTDWPTPSAVRPLPGPPTRRCGGVLRTDGSFTPVAHPEPLTDAERWTTGSDGGHGAVVRELLARPPREFYPTHSAAPCS